MIASIGMTDRDPNKMKESVRERYGEIARTPVKRNAHSCCCGSGDFESLSGYSEEELSSIPEGAFLGLGCGNPLAIASLKEGESVLDLGSGAGIDCFLAANKVGPTGRVIGVDMTPEMIQRARENAKKGNYANVEFRLGDIEHLPVDDKSVDVVISNCVINLVPDKKKAFAEAFRVLKPGGRLMISDIVLSNELPESVRNSISAFTACIAGALMKEDYLRCIRSAGFVNINVVSEKQYPVVGMTSDACGCGCSSNGDLSLEDLTAIADSVLSINVHAVKPL
jgi:arsenite methyltransferase